VRDLYRYGLGFSTRGNVTSTSIDVPAGMAWDTLVVNKTQGSGQHVNVTVIDASTGNAVAGLPFFTANGEVDLSALDPVRYPSIRLNATLEGSGGSTPYVHYWGVSWVSKDAWRDTTFAGYRVRNKRSVDVADGAVQLSELDVDPSLVAYWKFDEGSGTTAYDFSPNGLDGDLKNGPTYVTGKSGQALEFDGSDDRVEHAHDSKFDFPGKMSVVAWVNANSTINELPIICKGTGAGGESFCLDIYNNKLRFFRRYNNGASVARADAGTTVSTGSWYHVAGVVDGSNVLMYINGTKITGTAYSGTYDTNSHAVTIGSRQQGSGAYNFNMKGMIDEVGLFSDALSSSEVKDLYERGMLKYNTSGSLSSKPVVPPNLKRFETLRINKTESTNTYLNITVLDGSTSSTLSGFRKLTSSTIDLSTINQRVHPKLIVKADLEGNGTATPILHDWSITFTDLVDSDQDGSEDQFDAFPYNPFEFRDTDGDGLGDTCDPDADNDGTPDVRDAFPTDDRETTDTDGDGIGDNSDTDDDGDGVPDTDDAFPKNPLEYLDTDGDGIGDGMDADADGNGVDDLLDWQDEVGSELVNVTALLLALRMSAHEDVVGIEGSLDDTATSAGDRFLDGLGSVNDSLTSDIRAMAAPISDQLEALGVHVDGDTGDLESWLVAAVDALEARLDEVNASLAGSMDALAARNDGLATGLSEEMSEMLAALAAFEANATGLEEGLRQRIADLSTATEDLNGQSLEGLRALLEDLAEDIEGTDADLGARLSTLAANISAFEEGTAEDMASIDEALEELSKLDAVSQDLAALDQALDDAQAQVDTTVEDSSEEQLSAASINFTLLIMAIVLAGVNILLAFRKGRERRRY
jgi:hypothetical protein